MQKYYGTFISTELINVSMLFSPWLPTFHGGLALWGWLSRYVSIRLLRLWMWFTVMKPRRGEMVTRNPPPRRLPVTIYRTCVSFFARFMRLLRSFKPPLFCQQKTRRLPEKQHFFGLLKINKLEHIHISLWGIVVLVLVEVDKLQNPNLLEETFRYKFSFSWFQGVFLLPRRFWPTNLWSAICPAVGSDLGEIEIIGINICEAIFVIRKEL